MVMVDVVLVVQRVVVRIGVVMVMVAVVMGLAMTVAMVMTGSNFREEMELWFLGRSHDLGLC